MTSIRSPQQLGRALRAARKQLGLTQPQLALAAGVGVISLGGDHFISLPILQAFAQKYGPISLIQFEDHSDTWPEDDLGRLDHGTWTYKAVKTGLIDPKTSCLVGIRTHCDDYCGLKIIDAP